MDVVVARHAESDQVLFGIVSESAPGMDVVDMEIGRAAAGLATPAVSL